VLKPVNRNGFINKQGPKSWLINMEGLTTGDGKSQGTLQCAHLTDSCPIPDLNQCESSTPPAFFFIRVAASNLHSILAYTHETLQSTTLRASLQMGQLIQDFSATTLSTETAAPNTLALTLLGDSKSSHVLF
jgi:hypothetical protein